jgi:hypothetical protein
MAASKKKHIGCIVDSNVLNDVKQIAEKENRSVSNMLEFFLKRGVGHQKRDFCLYSFLVSGCGRGKGEGQSE